MSYIPIVISYASVGFTLIYTSFLIKNKELEKIKLFLFPIGVMFTFITGLIPLAVTLNPDDASTFLPVTTSIFTIMAGCMMIFIYLYGQHLIENVLKRK